MDMIERLRASKARSEAESAARDEDAKRKAAARREEARAAGYRWATETAEYDELKSLVELWAARGKYLRGNAYLSHRLERITGQSDDVFHDGFAAGMKDAWEEVKDLI